MEFNAWLFWLANCGVNLWRFIAFPMYELCLLLKNAFWGSLMKFQCLDVLTWSFGKLYTTAIYGERDDVAYKKRIPLCQCGYSIKFWYKSESNHFVSATRLCWRIRQYTVILTIQVFISIHPRFLFIQCNDKERKKKEHRTKKVHP